MQNSVAEGFRCRIHEVQTHLAQVSEAKAAAPYRPGGWLRKEVLGHLLDSAANNHVRIAHAAISGHFEGPGYDQDGWVRMHAYANLDWGTLLQRWSDRNETISRLVGEIPERSLAATCKIGESQPVTLRFIIEDYLDHIDHHVAQILG